MTNMGPLKVNQQNSRYFEDGTGTPVYLTGSHTWSLFQDWQQVGREYISIDDFIALLNTNNHNFVRGWVCKSTILPWAKVNKISVNLMPYQRTGPGTAFDGKPKFDLYKFNENYFTNLRNSAIKFGENGIYMSMMMFWDTASNGGDYWNSHMFNVSNNINGINGDFNSDGSGVEIYDLNALTNPSYPERGEILELHKRFVLKIIDTLGDLDNIIWEIGNNLINPSSISFQKYFIDFIRYYESSKQNQHAVGFTSMMGSSGSNDIIFNSLADWIAPKDDQNSDYSFEVPASTGIKVIISDSDDLSINLAVPSNTKEHDYRQWAWKSLTRGINPILMDDPLSTWNVPQIFALPAARRYLGESRVYADRVDLEYTIPHGELSSTRYCLANPGNDYIIYQSGTGPFTVNMIAGEYYYEWFNPQVGFLEDSGTITVNHGQYTFTPPSSGDMVLFLSTTEPSDLLVLPQNEMTIIYVDSEELIENQLPVGNILDGDPETFWRTKFYPEEDPFPHEVWIDLGKTHNVAGFRLLPRQAENWMNSLVKDFQFYVSDNTNIWGTPAVTDALPFDKSEQQVTFPEKQGRYIRLVIFSEHRPDETSTAIAELNILVKSVTDCPNVCLSRDLYSQKLVDGICVTDQLLERNSPSCGVDLCEGVVCGNVCLGSDFYSQKCDPATGNCVTDQLLERNSPSCVVDPCEGVVCGNVCLGSDLYSQKCDPATGNCVTDQLLEQNSSSCGVDPCEGVVCGNVCVGDDLWSQRCNPDNGQCEPDQLILQNSIICKIPDDIPTDKSTINTYLILGGMGVLALAILISKK